MNVLVYIDRKNKKIIRTEPPEFAQVIREIPNTTLVAIPPVVVDLATGRTEPMNLRFVEEKK